MTQPKTNESHPRAVGHEMIGDSLNTPTLQFDLLAEIEHLHKEDAWMQGAESSSRTLVKHPDLRIVLIAMKKTMRMHEHTAAVTTSIQTLTGFIRLRLPDRTADLPAGHMLVLDPDVPHDVEAEEDSAFLLTLSWHAKQEVNQDRTLR